ncbi:hypothetical protein L6452_15931 [Arctium lappa]|uniref:Uncharacterized protein n=1 Tax=Arctium lappa TaxID=4217 RepID=A0ACB9CQP2_ARCLA|nr:hypothetical protein L6452_15931 [Arctium lappa]
MSIIQSLPNLEVLKLKANAFMGRQWDACEQQFRQLKLLTLDNLDIKQWEASSTSFPCLKQLSLSKCNDLEEIPLEIGEIATLELIETDSWSRSVVESVKRIQQEQHEVGNYELKITVDRMELSFYLERMNSTKADGSMLRIQKSRLTFAQQRVRVCWFLEERLAHGTAE